MIPEPNTPADYTGFLNLIVSHPFLAAGILFIVVLGVIFHSLIDETVRAIVRKLTNGKSSDSLSQRSTPTVAPPGMVSVLIIDDQYTDYPIVKILGDKKKYPWINCTAIPDLKTIEDPTLQMADIVFVDIRGVGKYLTPQYEGLGIAEMILDKYPEKKVILYSSESKHDFTHPVLARVHGRLLKEAEPRSFIAYIEDVRKH